jgi:hypothetical protein
MMAPKKDKGKSQALVLTSESNVAPASPISATELANRFAPLELTIPLHLTPAHWSLLLTLLLMLLKSPGLLALPLKSLLVMFCFLIPSIYFL